MVSLLLVLLACVVYVYAVSSPSISETFQAKVSVSVTTAFGNGTGVGIWAADESEQVSIEEYKFDDDTFDTFSLNRYDLGTLYRIFPMNQSNCQTFTTKDTMPKTWNWVSNTKHVGNDTYNGIAVDIWESVVGYSTRRLAVMSNATSVPVYLHKFGTERNTYIVFQSYSNDTPDVAIFAVPDICQKPSTPSPKKLLTCMSSTQIVANAQVWVDNHVPYNIDATYMSYRTDCSGYVSYTWQAGAPGLDTAEFYMQAFPITKEELQPGDCMLDAGDHVCLFGGWTDENQTHCIYEQMRQTRELMGRGEMRKDMAYEETQPCADNPNWCGTLKHPTLYPYYYDGSDFLPYRFNGFCGASTGSSTTTASSYEASSADFGHSIKGGIGSVPSVEEQAKDFEF